MPRPAPGSRANADLGGGHVGDAWTAIGHPHHQAARPVLGLEGELDLAVAGMDEGVAADLGQGRRDLGLPSRTGKPSSAAIAMARDLTSTRSRSSAIS